MDRIKIRRGKLPLLLLCFGGEAINRKGSVMLLALVLSMAVLPAAGTLAYIARSGLAAALDDYHRTKAIYAARGAVSLAGADLQKGGDGQTIWPDSDIMLTVSVRETAQGWQVVASARSDRAVAEEQSYIPKVDIRPASAGGPDSEFSVDGESP